MSNIGKPCERALWYELNQPDDKEALRPETYLKFLYGDIIEEVMLFLAELAGHRVEGRQTESNIQGVKGHRDAVIDGFLVDVKSASSFSFKKFQSGGLKDNDPFGYIPQLQSYLHDGQDDPIVTVKDKAGFLAVDKTLGHICLDIHDKDDKNWPEVYDQKKEMVKGEIPQRAFQPEPFGKSGNMKLGFNCSYCSFSSTCYPETRTFLYSTGPVKLTTVEYEPNVPELK